MKAEAIRKPSKFTPKELILTFHSAEEMARFYAMFNHEAITGGILDDEDGAREIREEMSALFRGVHTLSSARWEKLNRMIVKDWRDA